MSQEEVNGPISDPPRLPQDDRALLQQLANNMNVMMDSIRQIQERMQQVEEQQAPPPLEESFVQENEIHEEEEQEPQERGQAPPVRGGIGMRGRGRGIPMDRLRVQIRGDQNYQRREPPQSGNEEEAYENMEEQYEQSMPKRREQERAPPNQRRRVEEEDQPYHAPPRRPIPRGRRQENDDKIQDINIVISTFKGLREPETYMEWERKVDIAFEFRNYSKRKKLKLVVQ